MDRKRDDLTIGELAALAGVGVETVRFYQRKYQLQAFQFGTWAFSPAFGAQAGLFFSTQKPMRDECQSRLLREN